MQLAHYNAIQLWCGGEKSGTSLYLTNGGVVNHPRRQGLLPRGHKHMDLREGPNLELHVAGNVWE